MDVDGWLLVCPGTKVVVVPISQVSEYKSEFNQN